MRLSRFVPRARGARITTAIAVIAAVAAGASGDIGASVRPAAAQSADGAVVTLTGHAGAAVTVRPLHIPLPIPTQQQISYTAGYANARKLGSSALLGEPPPPTADLDITLFQSFEFPVGPDCGMTTGPECTSIVYSTAELNYRGHPELPPATDTFLAYGFVPVTATIQLIDEQGNCPAPTAANPAHTVAGGVCLLTIQHGQYPAGQETTATASVTVRVSGLRIDGTALNVGSRCEARPASLQAVGSSSGTVSTAPPGQYLILEGGTLTGTVTIPAFTGCVTPSGENVNALVTSAVSGSGNDVQLTQGDLCLVGSGCVPTPPTPDRSHGQVLLQTFGASANNGDESGAINCTSASHATAVTGRAGAIGSIGAVGSFSLSGCTAQMDGASCTAQGKGLPWPLDVASYDPVSGQATATIGDSDTPFDLDFTCKTSPGAPACSVEVTSNAQTTFGPGSVNVIYDYRSRTISDFGAALAPVSSTCPGFIASNPNADDELELFVPSYVVNSP